MKTIKTLLVGAVFSIISFTAIGQVQFGLKANLGSSWISSSNLKSNFETQMNRDVDIREWDVSYRPGVMIGIGGVANYELSTKLTLQGELSVNYQQSNIRINYLEDTRGGAGNGETEEISSEARISSVRFSVPVTLRYSLGLDKPVLIAGLEANFLNTPQIASSESELVREFENNNEVASQSSAEAITADLDVFNNARFNFLLGVAKSVEISGKQLSVQLTYHLPLSSSEMHNFNERVAFDNNTSGNNEVFGVQGKINADQDVVAYPLNDFRMHFLDFSITYMF